MELQVLAESVRNKMGLRMVKSQTPEVSFIGWFWFFETV